MTCKDCPHFNVCESFGVFMPKEIETTFDQARLDLINSKWKNCKFRNDKSRFIELPCKVGDTFYAIVNEQVIAYNCVGFKYGHSAVTRKNNELLLLTVYDMEFIFGEEAFLSNEEAEAKLKELNENV